MVKKYITLLFTVLVINLFISTSAFANPKEIKLAEKVKANITKLGAGKDARVEVKLKDRTKLKGYVSQINENSFVVIDEKTGASTEVPYPNAKQVKGNNLSTGVTIAIVAGILVVAIILAATVFAGS